MAGQEIAEFAALVKELKERSGASYGTLAGKLHVSTSTLHRYCNGDAVPADFAPVARLARLCGAGAEEQVQLHRRWILADEARRRPAGDVESAPESSSESAPEADAVEDIDVGPDVVGVDRRPRKGRRNLRIALTAAAVVALGVPTAYVAARHGDGGGGDGSQAGSLAGASVSASPQASGAGKKSASPSASASVSASASPSVTASHPAGKASGGAKTVGSGVPVSVGISSYNWGDPCGQHYVLDQPPANVPPPPSDPDESHSWGNALGGVSGGGIRLQLTATSKSTESVVLSGLRVRTVSRGVPLGWTAYSMGEGCGSGVTPRSFDVDLDAAQPLAEPVGGTQGDVKIPAVDFPYKVSANDPQVLNLNVHTDAHDVRWYLEVKWSNGAQSGIVRVDDQGQPFRLSGIKGKPVYLYDRTSNVWEKKTEN
ncbi:helix-turn-helix domain-containing protein [Streptomyces beijiangensis]|uniref:Helix-turn-helix domain-containing protein n=1 Tax=Streptomyces beijiangensis TaxID=163361 RepID=A0A939FBK8_9ACTN|nr:helix-turn-helix transcriptional regulator [Streptomyces beijiangensis]MBO0516261.1 helix-turn-helix domain-containing protein [Streptomyces beijiangensis]